MGKQSKVGWGLIGASNIAREHMFKAIASQPGQYVRAVQSQSIDRARAFAGEFEIPAAYSSIEAILADPEVQVVYISTTNESHHPIALAAAAAGKHILCEKPLALTVAHAEEMAAAAKAANVILATNFHLRNAATHQKIRELIASNAIGRPLFARVFHAVHLPPKLQGWRVNNPAAGGGVVLDISVHDIDTLRFVLDANLVEVTAMTHSTSMSQAGLEDGVMAVLRFDNGVVAQIHDAFTVKFADTGIEIHGETGSIYGSRVMTQQPIGTVRLRTSEGDSEIEIQHHNLYERSVSAFTAAVRGEGHPAAREVDGVRALAGAIAIAQSAASGEKQRLI